MCDSIVFPGCIYLSALLFPAHWTQPQAHKVLTKIQTSHILSWHQQVPSGEGMHRKRSPPSIWITSFEELSRQFPEHFYFHHPAHIPYISIKILFSDQINFSYHLEILSSQRAVYLRELKLCECWCEFLSPCIIG